MLNKKYKMTKTQQQQQQQQQQPQQEAPHHSLRSKADVKSSWIIFSRNGWQHVPDLVFGDLMMMLGTESLIKCRQVCQSWNVMISVMTKRERSTILSKERYKGESKAYKDKTKL